MFAFELNGTFRKRKSSERIYPMTVGLDSNFRQDVWVCHFHGYGIGALCPPVSVKLENVWCLLDFIVAVHGWGGVGSGWSTESQGLFVWE